MLDTLPDLNLFSLSCRLRAGFRCLRPGMLAVLTVVGMVLCSGALARDDVRLGIQLEPPALDPTVTASASAGEITYGNLFEGLTMVGPDGRLMPRLAVSWQRSEDGLSYDFTLRRGVRFHDGREFNALVAAFSLRRILAEDSGNPQRNWFAKIKTVETVGSDHIRVLLHAPDALLPFALALPAAVMVHPASVADNATQPVGTGPFRLGNWERGRMVSLIRNENYWGKAPALARADFVFMHASSETGNMLAEGLVDGLISVTRVTDRFMVRPDYRMTERGLESKLILAINNARPPFDDLRVRQALSHAVDRSLLRELYGPQFSPVMIGSHFAPTHPAYVDLLGRYPYSPEKARALLETAGVSEGYEVELIIPPTDYGRYGAQSIADDLEEIGFRVEIVEYEWGDWLEKVFRRHDYALTLILHVEPMDIDIYARDDYYFNYDNEAFKPIWSQVLSADSEGEMNRRLQEAQRRITEDAVNVFLLMRPEQNLMHRDLSGFWEKSPIPSFILEDLRWTR